MPEKDLTHLSHRDLALFTDLYELTMAQSYFQHQMSSTATFSLFVRNYPPNRAYLVSAGLEDVLRYLEQLSFTPQDIDYLHSLALFSQDFLDYLSTLRFTGDVWAIPEGRLFFQDEPIVEITAPLIQGQLVETFVLNQINLQSLIATKAARCVWAARDKTVVDFALRRTHGIDAGMKVARSSFIGGCVGTSNTLAGRAYDIPVVGTMAHSYVTSFQQEIEAFRAFAQSFPQNTTLLIDTYDTLAGARKAAQIGKEMESQGHRLSGVRLDSGDLVALSREVRRILDQAGLNYVRILASGGLDEYEVEDILLQQAPIDGFGIGTKMGVSGDAPWFDIAYKLVKYDSRPVLKLSPGRESLPEEKQVFRYLDPQDVLQQDVIGLRTDSSEDHQADPLLRKVMEGGVLLAKLPGLKEIQSTFREEFQRLDPRFKAIRNPVQYPVLISDSLRTLQQKIQRDLEHQELLT